LGVRIAEESIEAEFHALSPAEFARERLGIPDLPEEFVAVIPDAVWVALCEPSSQVDSHPCLALDVSADRDWAAFAMAGRRADGRLHVETVHYQATTGWVLGRAVELWKAHSLPIRIDKSGPAGSFIAPLSEAGVKVVEVATADVAKATGQFIDACLNDGLRHISQMSLDKSLRGSMLKPSGEAQVWARRTSRVDISPLVAVTVALGGVPQVVSAPLGAWR
jgi:hypothetical protein